MNLPVKILDDLVTVSNSRVFVFAEARSGSNWLVETLNSHTDIILLKEIMQPAQREDFYFKNKVAGIADDSDVTYIEKQLFAGAGKLKGCKILFPQAVRFMDLYEFIFNYQQACFILLRRKNTIQGEVSGIMARENERWHSQSRVEKRSVIVNPEFLYQRVLWREATTNFCTDVIKSHCPHVFELTYEDLFSTQDMVLAAIWDFLKLNGNEIEKSSEVKLNTASLSDLLINYQEVKDFFQNKVPFFTMFE